MYITPIYDRNLEVNSIIHIRDRKQFNRLVKHEYSRLEKIGLTNRGKHLADIAIMNVIQDNPSLWEFHVLLDSKNIKGTLHGFVSQSEQAHIAEVLA